MADSVLPRVGILGAGALGLMYAAALEDAAVARVVLVANAQRVARLQGHVFTVNGMSRTFSAATPEAAGDLDLLIIAVKNYHLEACLPLVGPCLGPGTLVLSVLNGIDSEERLARAFPQAMLALCTVQAMDALKEGDQVSWTRLGTIVAGLPPRPVPGREILFGHLERAAAMFVRAGIPCPIVDDIRRRMWSKWMLNIGVNQVSAVTGATFSRFAKPEDGGDADVRQLWLMAMGEVLAVARAMNIGLEQADLEAWFPVIASLAPGGKTSMLQDVEQGRPTEVESFAGHLLALAREHGVEVPVNRTLYHSIRALERKWA